MQLNHLLLSALISVASAANTTVPDVPSSCSFTTTTATAQSDLDKLAGCENIVGDVVISGSLGNAALANVKAIYGSFKVNNATSLNNLAADSLQKVTGTLALQSLTILTSASFGSLEEVDTINLITLPAISTFSSNLKSANNILISDTSLESIDGFSDLEEVVVFNINNNRYLTSLKSSVKTVSDSLQFSFNGDQSSLTFDDLLWANNITLRDVDEVSFKKLESVNSSLGFINNSISSLSVDNLKSVGQSFSIVSNDDLTSVSFANLSTIGGALVVANNTNLKDLSTFKNVQTIGGALIVTGNFTTLDMSSLKSVRGGADIETKAGNFSCDPFKKLQSKGGIQGDNFVCKNGATSTSISLTSRSSSASQSSSSQRASATASGNSSNSASTAASTSSANKQKSKGAAAGLADSFQGSSLMGALAAVALALI